jgi:hypothetical protein
LLSFLMGKIGVEVLLPNKVYVHSAFPRSSARVAGRMI